MYDAISPFGPSVLSAEGDEWKAQRKVVSRSFGEQNNRFVWQETCRAVEELFEYWSEQGGGMKVDVPHALNITRELTLMVISSAGKYFHTWTCPDLSSITKAFGMSSTWKDGGDLPPHHKLVRFNPT
jgi:hypothetical protein